MMVVTVLYRSFIRSTGNLTGNTAGNSVTKPFSLILLAPEG